MRLYRRLTLGALMLAAVSACNAGGGSTPAPTTAPSKAPTATATTSATTSATTAPTAAPSVAVTMAATPQSSMGTLPTLKIGSVGFDEARVMAELYAQILEANGYTVDRTGIGLGDRPVVAPAIESGKIDLQPEYIGSRIGYELKNPPAGAPSPGPSPAITGATGDSATNLANLQTLMALKNMTVLNYTPAIDTNAFVVRPDTATSLNLTKMSDLAAVQGQLKWGLPTDCPTNILCGAPGGALQAQYGISADTIANATSLAACDVPMADALKNKTIDIAELCSTQPDIIVNGWTILQDDKQTQPADNIAPIVRDDYLAQVPANDFETLLNEVSEAIDTPTLADLYKQVSVDHKDPHDVAAQWLKDHGFIQ